jgi:hypothetical protein
MHAEWVIRLVARQHIGEAQHRVEHNNGPETEKAGFHCRNPAFSSARDHRFGVEVWEIG